MAKHQPSLAAFALQHLLASDQVVAGRTQQPFNLLAPMLELHALNLVTWPVTDRRRLGVDCRQAAGQQPGSEDSAAAMER